MIDAFLRNGVKFLLSLRYRVRVRGLDEIARRGRRGIVFLPNHPALIDPIIVMTYLNKPFAPRVLADVDQIERFFIRRLARRVGAVPVPDMAKYGPGVRPQIEQAVAGCIAALKAGQNLVLYPSGHLYQSRFENLRGNSAVEAILRQAPEVRVVLVRTGGLWGSSFSLASGAVPNVAGNMKQGALYLLANFLLFAPRREVTIDLHEPEDFPRAGARGQVNRFLEDYYNRDAPPNTYVPYTIWERGGVRQLPDPDLSVRHERAEVPQGTRRRATGFLRELTGVESLRDEDSLAGDLGMDSLAKAGLMTWMEKEFGFPQGDVDSLQTVGDVLAGACGDSIFARPVELVPPSRRWRRNWGDRRVALPRGATITEVFLAQARRGSGRVIVADQAGGEKSYRDLIAGIFVLRRRIRKLPGARVGIMLPASVAADATYLATLFAGKIPVMVNWTAGARNIVPSLDGVGARAVLTARRLIERLEAQGIDLSALKNRWVFLEDLAGGISTGERLLAWLRSRVSWSALRRAQVPETAVVLFTSGSETLPKAVPLTHANLLANIRAVLSVITVRADDRMACILPPFHAFGLTVNVLAPLLAGFRGVYHPNPTEAWVLARLIGAYRASLLVGTPTFLAGITRAAGATNLAALRLVVTGAERCPERTYQALAERCRGAVILEGYGVTECSPIVALGDEKNPRPFTIGKVLPALEWALVDAETFQAVGVNQDGVLLVRGATIFGGYLSADAPSPFVQFAGKQWYCTGDLVCRDQAGVLTFKGRLKRFAKIGGEMISLPAIEAVLEERYATDRDEGPVLAVEALQADPARTELVLFTTLALARQTVNHEIRQAGLSPLHQVARVVRLEKIPILGTGKTDYRALQGLVSGPETR